MTAENNITRLLRALVTPIQDLEAAGQQLLNLRDVDSASGVTLDVIGVKVGADARAGLDDETFRRQIRATVATHRSTGTVEAILKVVNLIVYDDAARVVINAPQANTQIGPTLPPDFYTLDAAAQDAVIATLLAKLGSVPGANGAALELEVQNVAIASDAAYQATLVRFVSRAKSGGVRVVVETWPLTDASTLFAFGDGPGLGYGNALDPTTGGEFISGVAA